MIAAPEATSLPFPGATGRGVKIAIIDSGINASHPHIVAKTSGVLIGTPDAGPADDSPVWNDVLGHGTAVAAAIQEKAPEAEYYAVKLFDKALRSTSARLIEAIEWSIDNQMDLINLSLGTPNFEYRSAFEALISKAGQTGTVMICALNDKGRAILPGTLNGVLPVEVDWHLTRHAFRVGQSRGGLFFSASGFPRPLPGVSPTRNLSGISFAVANMTGLVARACGGMGRQSLKQIEEALTAESLRLSQ